MARFGVSSWTNILRFLLYMNLGYLDLLHSKYETEAAENSSARPIYRLAVTLNPPLVGWSEKRNEYYGLIVDIMKEVSILAKFDYVIHDVDKNDVAYHDGGFFAGVIGEVNGSKADIGADDVTVNDLNTQAVTFTVPFFETGAQILLKKPATTGSQFWLLLSPFSVGVWCLSACSFIVMSVLCCLIEKYSPYGRRHDSVGKQDGHRETIIHYMTCGGVLPSSKSAGAKVLSTLWWILIVALLVVYTSNLTCVCIATRRNAQTLPFKTFHEMAGQSNIQYGGWLDMRLNLNDDLQRRMNRFINSKYSQYSTLDEAVHKIRSTNGRYAAIVNGERGKSIVSDNCDLILLSEKLFDIYYRFSCQKNIEGEDLCSVITFALMSLQDSGTLFSIYKNWSEETSTQKCPESSEDEFDSRAGAPEMALKAISLEEMIPIFVLVLIGVLTAIVALFIEYNCRESSQTEEPSSELNETTQLENRQCSSVNNQRENQDV